MVRLGFRLLISGMVVALSSLSATAECRCSASPASRLADCLRKVADSGSFIFGHHDDTVYGVDWSGDENRSDVAETVGDYPALMSWDLGHLELDSTCNLDGVPFERIAREITAQHERGGINTLSWHLRNPASLADSWTKPEIDVVAAATVPGSDVNKVLSAWIEKAADFIGNLRDSKGNRIPVIFRPWHEHTGSWFWWGGDNTTDEAYKNLWSLTRSIFDSKGIDNVVWAYSPDKVSGPQEYMARYPGDEYVDILGADIYHVGGYNGTESYKNYMTGELAAAARLAADHGKILALTETGCEAVTVNDWYNSCLLPLTEGLPIAYICVWRNANRDSKAFKDAPAGHFYVPYPGHPEVDNFKRFHDNPRSLFVKDLSNICD